MNPAPFKAHGLFSQPIVNSDSGWCASDTVFHQPVRDLYNIVLLLSASGVAEHLTGFTIHDLNSRRLQKFEGRAVNALDLSLLQYTILRGAL